jgi:hypothetical protein
MMILKLLRSLIRESIETELEMGTVRDAMKRARPILKFLVPAGGDVDEAIEDFVRNNEGVWSSILSQGRIKYLGSRLQRQPLVPPCGDQRSAYDCNVILGPGTRKTALPHGSAVFLSL